MPNILVRRTAYFLVLGMYHIPISLLSTLLIEKYGKLHPKHDSLHESNCLYQRVFAVSFQCLYFASVLKIVETDPTSILKPHVKVGI